MTEPPVSPGRDPAPRGFSDPGRPRGTSETSDGPEAHRDSSRSRKTPPRIEETRAEGHARLLNVIAEELAAGRVVPCIRWPDLGWTSDEQAVRSRAVAACADCPALAACRRYVTDHPESGGVWAGKVYRPPLRGRRARREIVRENRI